MLNPITSKYHKESFLKFILLILIFSFSNSFSQQNPIKHKISKGETLSSIARKYNVKLSEIYKLNPDSKGKLKLKSILLIPVLYDKNTDLAEKKVEKVESNSPLNSDFHIVKRKETLFGIAKENNISIARLIELNPELEKSDLKSGQKLVVFQSLKNEKKITEKEVEKKIENPENQINDYEKEIIVHEVLAKETKYSLAKKYKTTIQKLEELNPQIVGGLPIGYKLLVYNPNKNVSKTIKNNTININSSNETEIKETEIVKNNSIINDTIVKVTTSEKIELANQLIEKASEQIGTRYHSGGTKPGGFDCSGLMCFTFENTSIKLPRTSREQAHFGNKIESSTAQKGDLIFFSTNGSGHINHVGMVVEQLDGEIKFIHASIHGGVIISSTSESYYKRCFVQVNRVLE